MADSWEDGYRQGLQAALARIHEEPELPLTGPHEYMLALVMWVIGLIAPVRAHRATVRATKAAIARKVEALLEQRLCLDCRQPVTDGEYDLCLACDDTEALR